MAKKITGEINRIPVFIGVTGHRHIRKNGDDLIKLKNAVKDAIAKICRNCSYTDFILLTSLASGADQAAAEAVIDMAREMEKNPKNKNKINIKFAVILPMKKEEYFTRIGADKSFLIPEDAANADELMKSEYCAFVYTMPKQKDVQQVDPVSQAALDDLQFCETARFISDNSFAGIALWDGNLAVEKIAGTGSTVRDFLHGKTYHRSRFPSITIPETRPIYHIYTPKTGVTPNVALDYKMRLLFPEPLLETGEKWFTLNGKSEAEKLESFTSKDWHKVGAERAVKVRKQLKAINRYNKDAVVYAKFIRDNGYGLNTSKAGWNTDSAFRKIEDDSGMFLNPGARAELCEKHYKTADALAMKYQNKRKHNIWWIVWIAGLAYISLNVFSDLVQSPWLLLLYLGLFVAALLINGRQKIIKLHSRFVDYRALAEGLRVQYFWYAADIKDDDAKGMKADRENAEPAFAQSYYLRRQKGQIEWIRQAIRSINLLALAGSKDTTNAGLGELTKVSEIWLGRMDEKDGTEWYNPTYGLKQNGQVGYFLATSLKNKKGINLKARPELAANATEAERKKHNEKLKKEALCLSEKFTYFNLLNWLVRICMGVSILIAVVLTVCLFAIPENAFVQQYTDIAMFVAGLLPVVAMVLREICGQMGYEEDVDRYAWYYNAFKRAVIEIDEINTDKKRSDFEKSVEIKKILFEIGEEALIENADWVMLNAKRVPEVPSN